MTDLELRQRLRQLRDARDPARDLWPAIAVRLQPAPAATRHVRRRRAPALAAAALLLLALGVGALLRPWHAALDPGLAGATPTPLHRTPTRAPHGDPRLLAGAIVLDTAHAQLEQALAAQPDSALLNDLLKRTQARRARLAQHAGQAG